MLQEDGNTSTKLFILVRKNSKIFVVCDANNLLAFKCILNSNLENHDMYVPHIHLESQNHHPYNP